MNRKTPSRKILRALCAQVGCDDGLDPRNHAKGWSGKVPRKPSRKAVQLAHQVAETLDAVFAGESRDVLLRNLRVISVVPAPDSSRLLATVAVPPPVDSENLVALLERLEKASGWLRCEAAAAITRKRTPTLTFRLALDEVDPAPDDFHTSRKPCIMESRRD